MVEKMTAVWLIVLTVLICAIIPAWMIWITTIPHEAKLIMSISTIIGSPDPLFLK